MPTIPTLLAFGLATFLLTVSPGPGVLYITARTVSQGRRAGFASMFGAESGEVVWMVAAATGLAAVLATSAATLTVLRFAGAAYLIGLGIYRWRKSGSLHLPRLASGGRTFIQGLLTQLVNPKVMIFFIAFFPQFLNESRPIAPQVLLLGVIYLAIALLVDFSYVMTASAVSRRFLSSPPLQKGSARASALTYVALGVAAAIER
jgi:threonine/homoserine/homoserine lactone efflux protein